MIVQYNEQNGWNHTAAQYPVQSRTNTVYGCAIDDTACGPIYCLSIILIMRNKNKTKIKPLSTQISNGNVASAKPNEIEQSQNFYFYSLCKFFFLFLVLRRKSAFSISKSDYKQKVTKYYKWNYE